MATLDEVTNAFMKADAAGDTESARVLAGEVRRLRSIEASPSEEALQGMASTLGSGNDQSEQPKSIVGGIGNFVSHAANLASNLGQMALHPLVTGGNLGTLGAGAVYKGLQELPKIVPGAPDIYPMIANPDTENALATANAAGQGMANSLQKISTLKGLGNAIYEDPFSAAMNLTGLGSVLGRGVGALAEANNLANVAKGANALAKASDVVNPLNLITKPIGLAVQSGGKLADLAAGNAGNIKAANMVRQSLQGGPTSLADAQAAIAANPNVPVMQALYDAGLISNPTMALGKKAIAADTTSQAFLADQAEKAAQQAHIANVAGGTSQEASLAAQQAARGAVNEVTTPLREQAMAGLNKPIDSEKLVGSIQDIIADPKLGLNKTSTQVLKNVIGDITDWTDRGGGQISQEALYSIRKNIGDAVGRAMAGRDPSSIARQTAMTVGQVQPLIDTALKNAGVDLTDYLAAHKAGMQGVSQMGMGAEGLSRLKNPQSFVDLVKGEAPDTVKDIFGGNQTNFNQAMGPNAAPFQNVANQLQRNLNIDAQAQAGSEGLQHVISDNTNPAIKVLSKFIPGAGTAEKIYSALKGNVSNSTIKALSTGFQNGANMTELLSNIPLTERLKVTQIIGRLINPITMNPNISNALNPNVQQSNNALAR